MSALPSSKTPAGDSGWSPQRPSGQVTRVEGWCVTDIGQFMVDPATPGSHLLGSVVNHRVFPDGESVRSSQIQGRRGDHIVTYTGSEYELGEPLVSYVEHFGPDPRARLLASLKEVAS